MEKYYGVKIIDAESMNLKEAEEKLKRNLKSMDEGGYFIKEQDGNKTWMAKWEFEQSFHQLNKLPFALALDALMHGENVTRTSWDNKEIWLQLINTVQAISPDHEKSDVPSVAPFIGIRIGENRFIPWVANQADMFAEDYAILPPRKKPKQPGL